VPPAFAPALSSQSSRRAKDRPPEAWWERGKEDNATRQLQYGSCHRSFTVRYPSPAKVKDELETWGQKSLVGLVRRRGKPDVAVRLYELISSDHEDDIYSVLLARSACAQLVLLWGGLPQAAHREATHATIPRETLEFLTGMSIT
jgi:hypothetical protein